MWDFPKEEVLPTTEAGKAVMECLRKLLHVTPENFEDLRAECEGLVPAEGAVQRDALVHESLKFIAWAQKHADDLKAKQKELEWAEQHNESTAEEVVDPAARPEVGEDGCMDAQRNSVCYTAVSYGLSEGIRKHPTMYEGLSEHASFEKVQEFLWLNNRHGCPKPCPRKNVDVTQFDKHPEMLTYKKSVADMSIDEMTRYINNEWDGYVSKMFDYHDDDPLPGATNKPKADLEAHEETHEETHDKKKVQDMSKEELTDLLNGDLAGYVAKAAANETEPEKATSDSAEVENASAEASGAEKNDSTPLFADVASINMSQMSEAAEAVEAANATSADSQKADSDAVDPQPAASEEVQEPHLETEQAMSP
jgi:hypothetical protein